MAIDLEAIRARLTSINWMEHLMASRNDMEALLLEIERLRAELDQCGTIAEDATTEADMQESYAAHLKAELAAVTAERDRLCTESMTTLVACERCGRGVPPKYGVSTSSGKTTQTLCAICASQELDRRWVLWRANRAERICLEEGRLKRAEAERDHWRTEAERLQAQIDAALLAIHGGSD